MNLQNTVVEGVIIVLVAGWIVYRQTRWQDLDPTRIWRGPIILGIIGFVRLRDAIPAAGIGAAAACLLALSAVLSIAVGLAMGALSQVRRAESGWQARTGLLGSLLWLVLLAVRIGIDLGAEQAGADMVVSLGAILLMLALNRAGRGVVLARRAGQPLLVTAD
ncbi:hypothetical protein OHB26_26385 [Nocardia sp. NBC_01503]|uniref:hypothetical protein n=1 Tax=Nocardia sp. NBC_01503 TaxID=2975997 RepID=UPI002E7BC224|nr:hypothetical protein [Nocardia sp. NBC_01503]WTL30446.1 hypothetical protein OHB26_26385 [Nocardia sp. NBC_01503]